MAAATAVDDDRSAKEQPIYWFCLLEQAVEDGDFTAAAEAQRELARLGVRVHYGRRRPATADDTRRVGRGR